MEKILCFTFLFVFLLHNDVRAEGSGSSGEFGKPFAGHAHSAFMDPEETDKAKAMSGIEPAAGRQDTTNPGSVHKNDTQRQSNPGTSPGKEGAQGNENK